MLHKVSCYVFVVACLKAQKLPVPSLFCGSNYSPDLFRVFRLQKKEAYREHSLACWMFGLRVQLVLQHSKAKRQGKPSDQYLDIQRS